MAMREQPTGHGRAPLVQQAITRWHTANNAEDPLRKEALEDKQFRNLQQWPEDIKASRSERGRERPCLTIDQIGEPIRQICNRQKEAKPSIQINPVSNGANEDGAEVRQGLIRRIEVDSHASSARAWAFEDAVTCGFGYYRIKTEFVYQGQGEVDGPALFDQQIRIESIENNLSVYCDPAAVRPDRRDARYYLIVSDLPKDEYERLYPESQVASLEDLRGLGDDMDPDWFPEGKIRVAEYYYKEFTKRKLALLSNGQVVDAKDAKTLMSELIKQTPGQALTVVREREVESHVVKWALINGVEVLDEKDWPGQFIPIIPVFGERLNVNGQRTYRGIVRAARDPQRMYNYNNSALVEEMALAPKAKVIMAEGQDEDHEEQWRQANVRNFPYLTYKPTTLIGNMVPPPQVAQFTDPAKIQSIVIAINQNKTDLRSTTGWYDATDPNRKNTDQSGKAILARQQSQAQGSVNYLDNLHWAIIFEAECVLDLLPKIYDRPGRVVEILTGENDTRKPVVLNQPFVEGQDGQPMPGDDQQLAAGIATLYDLTAGQYGVTVSIGASYTTRRQEAVDWQIRLIESNPQFFGPIMSDITVRNMDGPGHNEIADRLERAVPPQIKGDDQQNQDAAALQQQLQQAMQQIEMLSQELNAKTDYINTEQAKLDAEAQTTQAKLVAETQAEAEKLKVEIAKKQLELEAKREMLVLELQYQREELAMKLANEREIAELKAQIDLEKADKQAETARETAQVNAAAKTEARAN